MLKVHLQALAFVVVVLAFMAVAAAFGDTKPDCLHPDEYAEQTRPTPRDCNVPLCDTIEKKPGDRYTCTLNMTQNPHAHWTFMSVVHQPWAFATE